jgi:hypothetical protein
MSALSYVYAGAGAWSIAAVLVGHRIGGYLKRVDEAEHVNRIASLPPVPAPRPRAESDADWLPDWITGDELVDADEPAEITEDEIYNRLAYDIERNMRVLGDAA